MATLATLTNTLGSSPADLSVARLPLPADLLAGLQMNAIDLGQLGPVIDYRAQIESIGAAFGHPATLAASLSEHLVGAYLQPVLELEQAVRSLYEDVGRAWLLAKPHDAGQVAGILSAKQAPAVFTQPGSPSPSGNFGTDTAQPADWQTALADALRVGKVTPEGIVQWLLLQERGSQQLPLWEDIEVIAMDFERNGWRYDNLTAFARKHRIHRATVDRYLRLYEAATGQQIRPGQGRAKRKGMR